MRIPCPFCGPRGNEEFVPRGGTGPQRPGSVDLQHLGSADPQRLGSDDAEAWHDYVYLRDNVAGEHREYWQHVHGCRAWLIVTRDTRTHEVLGAEAAEQSA